MELCQLFIFSRYRERGRRDWRRDWRRGWRGHRAPDFGLGQGRDPSGIRLWPLAILVLWLCIVLARHWSPFNFVVTGDMFRERIPALLEIPFRSYYWANPFDALGEALTKILLGVPVGVLMMLFLPTPRTGAGRAIVFTAVALTGAAIFGVVELGPGVPAVAVSGRHRCAAWRPGDLLRRVGDASRPVGRPCVANLSQRRLERLDLGRRLQAGVERNRAVQELTGRVGRPAA